MENNDGSGLERIYKVRWTSGRAEKTNPLSSFSELSDVFARGRAE